MSLTTPRAISVNSSRFMIVEPLYFFISGSWPRHSPAITILLVVVSVSQPSRVLVRLSSSMPSLMSLARKASRIASEIWSHTLSGWPSETDSLVNRKFLCDTVGNPHVVRRPRRLASAGCGGAFCKDPLRGQDVGNCPPEVGGKRRKCLYFSP